MNPASAPAAAAPAVQKARHGNKRKGHGFQAKPLDEGTLTEAGNRVWPSKFGVSVTYELPSGLPAGLILDASVLCVGDKASLKRGPSGIKYRCARAWKLRQLDGTYLRTTSRQVAERFLATHGFKFVDVVDGVALVGSEADIENALLAPITPKEPVLKRRRPPTPGDDQELDAMYGRHSCEIFRKLRPAEDCRRCSHSTSQVPLDRGCNICTAK